MSNFIAKGQNFVFKGKKYEFIGMRNSNTKFPLIAFCITDGKRMKVTHRAIPALDAWFRLMTDTPILKKLFV